MSNNASFSGVFSSKLMALAVIIWLSKIARNLFLCYRSFGRFRCTDALSAVPKLVGQHVINPRCSSCIYPRSENRRIAEVTRSRRLNASSKSCPLCIEIIRIWSSSLTQISKVLLLLWNIPRPAGQSLLKLAASRKRSPYLK
jgi:hypothetical protein